MVQHVQSLGTHLSQGSQFPERATFVLPGQGSPVPLLLDNPFPGFVIINTINRSQICQVAGSVSMAGLSVEFSSSGDLLRGGWWFCSRWLLFLFLRSTLLFTFQDGLSVLHIPLAFTLSCQFRIFVGHTEQNLFLSREFVFVYRLVCRSQISVQAWRGWRNLYPWGGSPLIFLLPIKSLT